MTSRPNTNEKWSAAALYTAVYIGANGKELDKFGGKNWSET